MPNLDDTIESLREALKVSPDNLPLRMLLGENLLSSGRFDEAESEFTTALAKNPDNAKLAVSLAQACFSNGKYSQAQVILEDCLSKSEVPARAHLLYSRVMLNEGKLNDARTHYQSAIEREPGLKDQSLEDRLGLKEGNKQESRVSDGPERRQAATAGGEIHDYDIDDSEDSEFAAMVESAGIDFDDVGGMDAVKEQIRMKIIYPLQHPETFKAYGKKTGGGILLYGPPGCGKTYLARATAGQINARFIPIGLHQVLDMWIGSSERNLHEVFEIARKTNPSVLFFDEVDALAASRSDMKQTYHRHSINQFLNELDGVSTSNEGVLILAATNAPWDIDSAFRRPGRFDRIIFIPPPDTSARASILRIILKGKPQDNVDFDFIAKKTDKFSGADLKAPGRRLHRKENRRSHVQRQCAKTNHNKGPGTLTQSSKT